MSVTGAIFDCDGTLLDSMEAWLGAQDELARLANVHLSDEDTIHVGTLTLPETGRFFHERYGLGSSADDVLTMIDSYMEEQYRTSIVARKGALEFVKALAARDIPCTVASSTSQPLLQIALAKTGFTPYLKGIVSVDDVGVSKREPAAYNRARDIMGTETKSTWVFEDAAYALRTAHTAGYPTVGIYDNDLSATMEELALADIVITEFTDLDVNDFMKNH